jgi:hypothetical protein
MKAIVFHAIGDIRLEDVQMPDLKEDTATAITVATCPS